MSNNARPVFPFSAIVGQEEMKRALLLNIVDPGIGGVLIRGEKGTAKSTSVRSLGQILPDIRHADGCPFRCQEGRPEMMCPDCRGRIERGESIAWTTSPMRVVELPLSATEDRIAGTLDLEHVLRTGKKKFEPGVLAQANGNLLYVDEVNLLDDHIVDLLLDSAAMGVNYVEREGVSFSHPSRFVLVGSMNPEEGEIRPQLLDRFGLCTEIRGEKDHALRNEIVARRLAFDADPEAFTERFAGPTAAIRDSVASARGRLLSTETGDGLISAATAVSMFFGMEGHRADITLVRAARANAALDGRSSAGVPDIAAVAPMVLAHRIKRKPFEESKFDREGLEECLRSL
jgi:magnesium chelatase subunit I